MILVVEMWSHAIAGRVDAASAGGVAVALASLAAPLVLWPTTRQLAFAGLAVAEISAISESFPWTGNHRYFELFLCLFCAGLDTRVAGDRALLLRAVQWLTFVVLFASGLQKLAHGFYFEGHYLAYMAHEETFRPVLGFLLPPEELERLSSIRRAVGAGPYSVASPLFRAASNGIWIAEMGLALLLLLPTTRRLAVLGTVGMLVVIESAARELFFGMIFTNAVLVFWPSAVGRYTWPLFAVGSCAALLVRAGWLPEVTFH